MARAATTTDAFNAVAEPRRREILDALTQGERPVSELVEILGLVQPQVSRHLRVLREVGAVDVREEGRQRLYRLNPHALKPIHDWVSGYRHLWEERFELLDDVLTDLTQEDTHGWEQGNDADEHHGADLSQRPGNPHHADSQRTPTPRVQSLDLPRAGQEVVGRAPGRDDSS